MDLDMGLKGTRGHFNFHVKERQYYIVAQPMRLKYKAKGKRIGFSIEMKRLQGKGM